METNAYYLKKIRDILNQRLEIEKSFDGVSSNQDAKYIKDIYNVVKDLPEGGGGEELSNAYIIKAVHGGSSIAVYDTYENIVNAREKGLELFLRFLYRHGKTTGDATAFMPVLLPVAQSTRPDETMTVWFKGPVALAYQVQNQTSYDFENCYFNGVGELTLEFGESSIDTILPFQMHGLSFNYDNNDHNIGPFYTGSVLPWVYAS